MINNFYGYSDYILCIVLLSIGLYGMMMKNNIIKKVIGMGIFQVATILFYVSTASKWKATVPILDPTIKNDPNNYINPLPHTLMLTAIVVGVATAGVAFALIINIYKHYKTLNESEILERMNTEE